MTRSSRAKTTVKLELMRPKRASKVNPAMVESRADWSCASAMDAMKFCLKKQGGDLIHIEVVKESNEGRLVPRI